jgi:hypothetical protein
MSELLDELTYDREDDGVLVRKQLERVILERGAWATVLFVYQELDRDTGAFRAPRMTIVRFKKWRGAFRKHASFNIEGAQQARQLAVVFERWGADLGDEARDDEGGDDGRGESDGESDTEADAHRVGDDRVDDFVDNFVDAEG